jgi:two-component system, NarL family, response regulator NreC
MGAHRSRVLIVEDFVLIQESIRLALERECEIVGTAEDAETAIAAAAEMRPNVVTLDISLPGMGGFAAAESLTRTAPGVFVVFVTAYTDPAYVERAFAIGAKGYVLKGALQAELPAAVRAVVAGGRYLSPRLRDRVKLDF